MTGDSVLIFNLKVTGACHGDYLTVVPTADIESEINWTLGSAPADLTIVAWTVTPSVCVIKYAIVFAATTVEDDGIVVIDNVNGDLDMS
jgi:hypothetical protein